jgi:hypothetical protein
MKTKLLNFLSLFIVIIACFIVGVIIYWVTYPYKPLVFNEPEFPVLTKTVKQGGILKYTSNYCKYNEVAPLVYRTFANDLVFSTPPQTTNRPMGCHVVTIAVLVPHELPPGVYHIENTFSFQMNPLRVITIKENSETFTVVE